MPSLIRFVLANFSLGEAIGLIVAGVLLWITPEGFGMLVERGDNGPVAALLLAMGFGGSFGLGYLGTALALDT